MITSNPENYYSATANSSFVRPGLTANKNVKICIIGGGFAGINTALGLAERGIKNVVLCEAKNLAFGASGRNGGFVFAGFSRGPESLLKDLGPHAAKHLYKGTVDAVNLIRHRINQYKNRLPAHRCRRVLGELVSRSIYSEKFPETAFGKF